MDWLVVGKPYCGKTEFTKVLRRLLGTISVLKIGDYVREYHKVPPETISIEELTEIIEDYITCRSLPVIIDNPAKTAEQMRAVVNLLNEHGRDYEIIWINDHRTCVDFTKRGRSDDIFLEKKQKLFDEEEQGILQAALKSGRQIIPVYNTDKGFLFGLLKE